MLIRTTEQARIWRTQLERILFALSDKEASGSPDLYPTMKYDGNLITYKTRINWNGVLKQAAVDLWDNEENNPDNNPDLWNDINYRDGVRVIPNPITAAEAFDIDELGWWEGKVYKSKIPANVYTPVDYPDGWEIQ